MAAEAASAPSATAQLFVGLSVGTTESSVIEALGVSVRRVQLTPGVRVRAFPQLRLTRLQSPPLSASSGAATARNAAGTVHGSSANRPVEPLIPSSCPGGGGGRRRWPCDKKGVKRHSPSFTPRKNSSSGRRWSSVLRRPWLGRRALRRGARRRRRDRPVRPPLTTSAPRSAAGRAGAPRRRTTGSRASWRWQRRRDQPDRRRRRRRARVRPPY